MRAKLWTALPLPPTLIYSLVWVAGFLFRVVGGTRFDDSASRFDVALSALMPLVDAWFSNLWLICFVDFCVASDWYPERSRGRVTAIEAQLVS